MILRLSILLTVIAGSCVAHAANDNETQFKTKEYVPHRSANDLSYKASAYTPSGSPRSIGKPIGKSAGSSRWNIFKSGQTITEAKEVHDATLKDEPLYKQQKNISVSTIKADVNDIPEKKPFTESGRKLSDLKYKPADTVPAKNPLLKPRQSIEAPQ